MLMIMLPLLKEHKFDQSLGASTLPVCFKHQIRFYKVNSTKHDIINIHDDDNDLRTINDDDVDDRVAEHDDVEEILHPRHLPELVLRHLLYDF